MTGGCRPAQTAVTLLSPSVVTGSSRRFAKIGAPTDPEESS
jgi:hypothetical protein